MQRRTELSERQRRVLCGLVQEYIDRGEPVSSLWLARHGRFGVSSATVRSTLASLEDAGYLRQPHTSAGRVPTDAAYRCYVDHILQTRRPHRLTPAVVDRLKLASSVDDVMAGASQELSRLSHTVGFALTSAGPDTVLRQMHFVPLGERKVLVVVVSADGGVSHKPVELDEPITVDELWSAANYLNGQFAGRPLSAIRAAVMEQLLEDRVRFNELLARALELASMSFEEMPGQSVLAIQGASSLLDDPLEVEQLSREALRGLLQMIEEKHRLVKILTEYIEGPGLTVVIGTEHTTPDLRTFSLVASPLPGGQPRAIVGVIGPTRMRYTRAISAVENIGFTLSCLLTEPDKHSDS